MRINRDDISRVHDYYDEDYSCYKYNDPDDPYKLSYIYYDKHIKQFFMYGEDNERIYVEVE